MTYRMPPVRGTDAVMPAPIPAPLQATTGGTTGVRNVCGRLRIGGGVQHESTATDPDLGGLECTLRDGDLHRCTAVDGLPADGMQEVWGSNPHSSTQVKGIKSNVRSHGLGPLYSSKVPQPANRTPVRIQPPRRTGRLAWPANAGTGDEPGPG